ncbi:regulator of sigma E protease [Trypanosoma cruzi]|nr:regulator of sigma E protease [Trypanosoma cruzi]
MWRQWAEHKEGGGWCVREGHGDACCGARQRRAREGPCGVGMPRTVCGLDVPFVAWRVLVSLSRVCDASRLFTIVAMTCWQRFGLAVAVPPSGAARVDASQ